MFLYSTLASAAVAGGAALTWSAILRARAARFLVAAFTIRAGRGRNKASRRSCSFSFDILLEVVDSVAIPVALVAAGAESHAAVLKKVRRAAAITRPVNKVLPFCPRSIVTRRRQKLTTNKCTRRNQSYQSLHG